jgi:esterase/lipase superfamily enzyme
VLGVAILVHGLMGCAKDSLMPTPVVFDETGLDPFVGLPLPQRTTTTEVFVFADRKPRGAEVTGEYFSNDRDQALRLGIATVDVGTGMTWSGLHEESLRSRRRAQPRVKVTTFEPLGPVWTGIPRLDAEASVDHEVADRFLAALKVQLAGSKANDVYVFVHGFNTKFEDNLALAAELHHYLGREGVFLSYAWPSRGSVFKYDVDKASATYSTRYFRLLLTYLGQRLDAHKVHIIAHSAGAPIAVNAIRELCLMHYDEGTKAVQDRYRIGNLVLVAPDMDVGAFENGIKDEIVGVPEQLVVYVSSRDKALDFSRMIHGFARLGSPFTVLGAEDMQFLHEHDNVQLIDVAGAEKDHGSWLGHSYFRDDPWVSSDVLMILRHGAMPQDRGLVRVGDNPIWQFAPDYPQRATEAARRLYDDGE